MDAKTTGGVSPDMSAFKDKMYGGGLIAARMGRKVTLSAAQIAAQSAATGLVGGVIGSIMPDEKDKDGNVVKKHTFGSGFVTGARFGMSIPGANIPGPVGATIGMANIALTALEIAKFRNGQGS